MDQRTVGRAIAAALTVAAAAGLVFGWRRAGGLGALRGSGDDGSADEAWTCACGQVYRMTGEGRHRVFWVLGAPESEPVLGSDCVACERPLPA
jgi:hypothetical protein